MGSRCGGRRRALLLQLPHNLLSLRTPRPSPPRPSPRPSPSRSTGAFVVVPKHPLTAAPPPPSAAPFRCPCTPPRRHTPVTGHGRRTWPHPAAVHRRVRRDCRQAGQLCRQLHCPDRGLVLRDLQGEGAATSTSLWTTSHGHLIATGDSSAPASPLLLPTFDRVGTTTSALTTSTTDRGFVRFPVTPTPTTLALTRSTTPCTLYHHPHAPPHAIDAPSPSHPCYLWYPAPDPLSDRPSDRPADQLSDHPTYLPGRVSQADSGETKVLYLPAYSVNSREVHGVSRIVAREYADCCGCPCVQSRRSFTPACGPPSNFVNVTQRTLTLATCTLNFNAGKTLPTG